MVKYYVHVIVKIALPQKKKTNTKKMLCGLKEIIYRATYLYWPSYLVRLPFI